MPRKVWKNYITNLLRLSDSIPLMREFVFCLIVEKIIKIDVMVSRFDTEEEEEEEDEKNEEEETSNEAEKLDRIMCLVFEFLKREMTKKSPKQDDNDKEEATAIRSRGWSEVSDVSDRDTTTTKDDNRKDICDCASSVSYDCDSHTSEHMYSIHRVLRCTI